MGTPPWDPTRDMPVDVLKIDRSFVSGVDVIRRTRRTPTEPSTTRTSPPFGLHPDHHQLAARGALKRSLQRAAKGAGLPITWSEGNTPITASGSIDAGCAPPDRSPARCCAAPARQDLPLGNFRKLSHDLVAQMIVGEDPQALRRNQRRRRSTVAWISERSPTTFSDLLGDALRGCAARNACRGRRPESGRNSVGMSFTSNRIAVNQPEESASSASW